MPSDLVPKFNWELKGVYWRNVLVYGQCGHGSLQKCGWEPVGRPGRAKFQHQCLSLTCLAVTWHPHFPHLFQALTNLLEEGRCFARQKRVLSTIWTCMKRKEKPI